MLFTPEQIEDLRVGLSDIRPKFWLLREHHLDLVHERDVRLPGTAGRYRPPALASARESGSDPRFCRFGPKSLDC